MRGCSVLDLASGSKHAFRLRSCIGISIALSILLCACAHLDSAEAAQLTPVSFVDVAAQAGIDFVHANGATPEKYLPETMGGGVLMFDYDNDGWIDLFFVNSGSGVVSASRVGSPDTLYRNSHDGTFADVTDQSGLLPSGYSMGACSADYDNDGWEDLYVTNLFRNTLYRNLGDGRFADVTDASGTGSDVWSSSCAFGDVDNDGDVDLYVANYLEFSAADNKYCGDPVAGFRIYCDPTVYDGVPDVLYRNNGDGSFTDISRDSGIYSTEGKGLGVVFTDYDVDGWPDIYVANDLVANFLYHNLGDGTFEEVGLPAGVAVGGDGRPMSGMGTDMADMNGDGLPDGFVTNMDRETHNLYENIGGGLFVETTFQSGVGAATLPYVGWGTAFVDYDNDTDLDLAIATGAVLDNIADFRDATYAERNLLLRNDGQGRFLDVGREAGPGFAIVKVSRGLAVGDIDNDGDPDIVIGNNGQGADLLRNDGGNQGNALLVRTHGTRSNRDGIGARLSLSIGDVVLVRDVKAGSSYMGQNDIRVHFGMGAAREADRLEIQWPNGSVDVFEHIDANQILVVEEGGTLIRRIPFE